MPTATCHCGDVRVDVPTRPQQLTSCNCSICRRLGGLWAYYDLNEVQLQAAPEHTDQYIWGDRTLRVIRCKRCGCTTHWLPLKDEVGTRMGVNARNFDPEEIEGAQIHRFDGADTWKFLD